MSADNLRLPWCTPGQWDWRGNQLYAPDAQQTLLRDVTFWNCTQADKAAMAAAGQMRLVLTEVEAIMTIVAPRSDTHEYRACLEHVRRVLGSAESASVRDVSGGTKP